MYSTLSADVIRRTAFYFSFEEFVKHEELQMNDPDPNGMQKAEVMKMADHTIMNEGTLEELHQKIEEVLGLIQEG